MIAVTGEMSEDKTINGGGESLFAFLDGPKALWPPKETR